MATSRHPQSFCSFGQARADITPPVGIYHRMWGAATHDRATGVHRPLKATAMVFQSAEADGEGGSRQVLVAIDHVLFWAREMSEFLERVQKRSGIPRGQIIIAFSHTHAAGLMDLGRIDLPGGDLIAPYLTQLAEQVGELIEKAVAALQPVNITYGTGHCGLATHRDYWDEDSKQFVCGYHPGAEADDTVMVARINDLAGIPLAVVVNYACHPTTLAFANTLISPDFPGALREVVEGTTGVPCIFLQGASGDLGPREGFVGDVEVADRNGRQLAHAVLQVWESLPPAATRFDYTGPVVSGATLGIWKHVPLAEGERLSLARWQRRSWEVPLPYRKDLPRKEETREELKKWQDLEEEARVNKDDIQMRNCRAMIERMVRQTTKLEALPEGDNFPFPVTMWAMGDGIWLAVESELYYWFQQSIRREFPRIPIMVMTLANGSRASYLPTQQVYGLGIYQERIAVLSPGSLENLQSEVCEAIRGMIDLSAS